MENYREVKVADYVEELKRTGRYTVIQAEKFARIIAKQGKPGEKVISYSVDKNGNPIVEKEAVVQIDPETNQPGWIVTKATETAMPIVDRNGNVNQWIIDNKTFIKKYESTETNGFYKPKGGVQNFVRTDENITIEQWGEKMNIAAGGYINITNPNDMYAISGRDFTDTYKVINENIKTI